MSNDTHGHQTLAVAEFRANIGDTIARTAYTGERVIITRHGKPAAALISADDLELLEELEDAADHLAIREAMAEDDGTRYTLAEVDAMLGFDSSGGN